MKMQIKKRSRKVNLSNPKWINLSKTALKQLKGGDYIGIVDEVIT